MQTLFGGFFSGWWFYIRATYHVNPTKKEAFMPNLENNHTNAEELLIERVAINEGRYSFQVWDGYGNVHTISLVKELDSSLVVGIDSSFIEQDIDYPISPYGNGLMLFQGDEKPKRVYEFALINTEYPIEYWSFQSHRQLNDSDIPSLLTKLGIEIPEDDVEVSYSLIQVEDTKHFID